eukprot:scaffold1727_cov133-Cylindrotheca_fusiformis.AAC.45
MAVPPAISTGHKVTQQVRGVNPFCYYLAFIFVGFVLLVATDVIEISADFGTTSGPIDGTVTKEVGEFHIAENNTRLPEEDDVLKPTEQKTAEPDTKDPEPKTAAPDTKTPEQSNGDNDDDITGFGDGEPTLHKNRHLYRKRAQPRSGKERQKMADEWGKWELVDDKERPMTDYYAEYPNRDIPRERFPSNAWQIDEEYLSKFLPEGIALVQRAQEAILAEYGKTEGTFAERSQMFQMTQDGKRKGYDNGGWVTSKSWDGLKRRLLHALMTEGGHSAAAGHGNHFTQSYTLQVQWILEAVFARLGVKHEARNFGNGGLGTTHNGIGAGSIYGPDVDMLMWDSGMTEGRDLAGIELMHRQGLIGGIKVPMLWTLATVAAKKLRAQGADVAIAGSGMSGIPIGASIEEVEKMPWAAQYVKCKGSIKSLCKKNEYIGKCWVPRDDVTPVRQNKSPGGRASWHPGNRIHQVSGRAIAFPILQALKEVLVMWNEAEDYRLADDAWHMTAYYENQRQELMRAGTVEGKCNAYKGLQFTCEVPVKVGTLLMSCQARTEFTPRAYPAYTNLRTLMHPDMRAEINEPAKNFYNPPDVFNPALHPPPSAVDVLAIVEAGVDFKPVLVPDYTGFYKTPTFSKPPSVPVGKGNRLSTLAGDEFCDGTVDSFCDRRKGNHCLLYGHNDKRNGILHNSLSGWLVLNLPDVKYGKIVIKVETWHIRRALKWNHVNGGNSTRQLGNAPPYCNAFAFEYAIDGQVTSLKTNEWLSRVNKLQRVVEVATLLDDPNYTEGEEKEVEIAIRMRGCARKKVFFKLRLTKLGRARGNKMHHIILSSTFFHSTGLVQNCCPRRSRQDNQKLHGVIIRAQHPDAAL